MRTKAAFVFHWLSDSDAILDLVGDGSVLKMT